MLWRDAQCWVSGPRWRCRTSTGTYHHLRFLQRTTPPRGGPRLRKLPASLLSDVLPPQGQPFVIYSLETRSRVPVTDSCLNPEPNTTAAKKFRMQYCYSTRTTWHWKCLRLKFMTHKSCSTHPSVAHCVCGCSIFSKLKTRPFLRLTPLLQKWEE